MKFNKHFSILLITLFIFNFLSINPTSAQPNPPPEKPDLELLQEYVQKAFPESGEDSKTPLAPEALYSPTLYPYRLAKAEPDECFNGVGQPYTGTVSLGCTDSPYYLSGLTQPKVNQAYVWGLTKYNQYVWMVIFPLVLASQSYFSHRLKLKALSRSSGQASAHALQAVHLLLTYRGADSRVT